MKKAKSAKSTKSTKKMIDKKRVKAGRLIRVENTKKLTNASKEYCSLWVEDDDGDNERCWFITPSEVARLEHRSKRNKEDWTKKGLLTNLID